jgi:hypothetical protein
MVASGKGNNRLGVSILVRGLVPGAAVGVGTHGGIVLEGDWLNPAPDGAGSFGSREEGIQTEKAYREQKYERHADNQHVQTGQWAMQEGGGRHLQLLKLGITNA